MFHFNRYVELVILYTYVITVGCQQKSGNTASGNAMDLAVMNMNMMGHNSKCDIQPCQSVCQILNTTSGCYICRSSCNSGTGAGSEFNAPLNPLLQMPMGGISGCDWMQCPMSCKRSYSYGCLKCDCISTYTELTTKLTRQPAYPTYSINTTKQSFTRPEISDDQTSHPQTRPTIVTPAVQLTFTPSRATRLSPLITTQPAKILHDKTSLSLTAQRYPITEVTFVRHTVTVPSLLSMLGNTNSPSSYGVTNRTGIQVENDRKHTNASKNTGSNNDTSLNSILVFVVSTFFVISLTLSVVLFIAWRRAARKLRRHRNELYFVQKAYRQDSNARLHNNSFDMDEPVYARIDNKPKEHNCKPEVPPRSPPMTPISPTTPHIELLLRTTSLSSETSAKQADYLSNDYLELS